MKIHFYMYMYTLDVCRSNIHAPTHPPTHPQVCTDASKTIGPHSVGKVALLQVHVHACMLWNSCTRAHSSALIAYNHMVLLLICSMLAREVPVVYEHA